MMNSDPYQIALADVANEINADLVIEYHTATIKLSNQQLQSLKDNGFPTDVMSCIMAGFLLSGQSKEDVEKFLNEAVKVNGSPKVSFEASEKGGLNIHSKEENPMLDRLVQAIG